MPLTYLSIDNFRAFKEKTEFGFAPITILTGTNSSGKSSLVDALRILQNYTDEIPDPDSKKFWDKVINFKDDYFHFRVPDFEDLFNYHSGNDSISFEFKCRFTGMTELVSLCLEFGRKDEKGYEGILKSLLYKSEGGVIFFSMEIDERNYTVEKEGVSLSKRDLSKNIVCLSINFGYLYKKFSQEIEQVIDLYDKLLNEKNNKTQKEDFLLKIPKEFRFGSLRNSNEINKYKNIKKDFENDKPVYDINLLGLKKGQENKNDVERLNKILNENIFIYINGNYDEDISGSIDLVLHDPVTAILFSDGGEYIYPDNDTNMFLSQYFYYSDQDKNQDFKLPTEAITDLGHLFYDKFVQENIYNSISELKENLKFNYVSSTRNTIPGRTYKKENGTSFGNLLSEFKEKDPQTNEKVKLFLNKYLSYFDIGEKIEIKRNPDGAYNIHTLRQGKEINLIDLGFGISQVMPILLQILLTAFDGKTNSIIIEEPETNLHPAMQSKLADMIIDANKEFEIQFVIETHSEYIIRKLQYLTAKAVIKPEDTQIYYFFHPEHIPKGEPQVKKINIDAEGALSGDFGTGFFDEADNIAIDLYNLFTQSRKN